jgi:hypothetical protein
MRADLDLALAEDPALFRYVVRCGNAIFETRVLDSNNGGAAAVGWVVAIYQRQWFGAIE